MRLTSTLFSLASSDAASDAKRLACPSRIILPACETSQLDSEGGAWRMAHILSKLDSECENGVKVELIGRRHDRTFIGLLTRGGMLLDPSVMKYGPNYRVWGWPVISSALLINWQAGRRPSTFLIYPRYAFHRPSNRSSRKLPDHQREGPTDLICPFNA